MLPLGATATLPAAVVFEYPFDRIDDVISPADIGETMADYRAAVDRAVDALKLAPPTAAPAS